MNLESAVAASLALVVDSALSSDRAFLYVVDCALVRVVYFRVEGADLLPLGSVTGLPITLQRHCGAVTVEHTKSFFAGGQEK